MADLYRKSSLEKLSSPEQLDRMIKISSPMSWLALIAVFLVILATVIWSIVGTLPTTETVSGMIVDPHHVNSVYADMSGTLEKYCVDTGKNVKSGEKIATKTDNPSTLPFTKLSYACTTPHVMSGINTGRIILARTI